MPRYTVPVDDMICTQRTMVARGFTTRKHSRKPAPRHDRQRTASGFRRHHLCRVMEPPLRTAISVDTARRSPRHGRPSIRPISPQDPFGWGDIPDHVARLAFCPQDELPGFHDPGAKGPRLWKNLAPSPHQRIKFSTAAPASISTRRIHPILASR